MIELVFFLVSGIVFFLALSILALKLRPKIDASAPVAALRQMVDLESLTFARSDLLPDRNDYQLLFSEPQLREVAKQLRDDRRRILLLWLSVLQKDMKTLWSFRRFLARNGARVTFFEEVGIAVTAMCALLCVSCLRGVVAVAGPFVIGALLQRTRHQLELTAGSCAVVLGRLPPATWSELQRNWGKGAA